MSGADALRGRVALVTGAGAGAARAVALALGGAGAAVVANDVNPDRAGAVAAEIVAAGGRAVAWSADVGSRFQVGALIEHTRDVYGGLHVVVNGWRVNKRAPALALDEYDWRRVLEINLTGAFFVSQMAARVMADEGGGLIVHLLGPADPEATGQAPYLASQAGLAALGRALAVELAPLGVGSAVVSEADGPEQVVAAVLRLARGAPPGDSLAAG